MSVDHHQRHEGTEGSLPQEAYRLLAHANLLRIRGNWNEAIEECMAAMRLLPGNASAQSLLGDIYENSGNIDDAIQWYRMALDVNPTSPADQLKLRRLLDTKLQQMPIPGLTTATTPLAGSRYPEPLPQSRPPVAADRIIRIAAFASALVVVFIIVYGFLVARSRPPVGPGLTSGAVPSVDPGPSSFFAPPAITLNPQLAPVNPKWRDGAEAAALNTLRANPDLSNNGIAVADALIDPRDRHLTVTVSADVLPSAGRDYYLRHSLRVLRAASSAVDSEVSTFTVRFLSAPADGVTPISPALVFAADTSRPFVMPENQDIATVSVQQMQTMMANIWWSPAVP